MRCLFMGLLLLLLTGCFATDPRDPYESFNRKMYFINELGDKILLKPVAEVYDAALPQEAQNRVSDFFKNLTSPFSALNYFVQGNLMAGGKTLFGFALNSTFGFFGLVDLATPMQLGVKQVNLGDTLAVWGGGAGNYLVLPFFGPTTTRGAAGLALSFRVKDKTLLPRIAKGNTRLAANMLDIVNTRATYLDADKTLNEIALDPYIFVREAYLQRLNMKSSSENTTIPALPASQSNASEADWE